MPTLKDVAEQSGVSIATASAVINGAEWVTEATRERVQASIQALGYRPNRLARSLKKRAGIAIGAIVSDLTNPFFTEIVRSLSHHLREHDRTLFLCDSDHRFDLGDLNLSLLRETQVDGLVLIGDSVREESLSSFLQSVHGIPVVAIERAYDLEGVHTLLVDSEDGAYQATKHLLDEGYRRIAMIGGPQAGPGSTSYGRQRRLEGYKRALADAGLPFDPALTFAGTFRYGSGQEAMRYFLSLSRRPDALFAANDLMALGAMAQAREAGLSIPEDLAFVGYDDIPMAALTSPRLTTVAMPKQALGQAAARLLLDPRDREHAPLRQLFSAHLLIRDSSIPRLRRVA